MMILFKKRASRINIEPVCPARLAAARLRRAFYWPILAAPPVLAIQTSFSRKYNIYHVQLERNLLELEDEKEYMKGKVTDLF
jgi:hypothetical protein